MYKTLIGITPYKLVYRKPYHLLVKLEHKAYWAIRFLNFNLDITCEKRNLHIHDLEEWHLLVDENARLYKEQNKRYHD